MNAERLLAHFDTISEAPDAVARLRRFILDLAVRGKLVEQDPEDQDKTARERLVEFAESCSLIPGSWLYVPLACLLAEDTRNGYSRKPDDAEDGFPILRISASTARHDGLVDEGEFKLISDIGEVLASQYAVQRGDLLACRFNGNKAYVGRLSLFTGYSGKQFIYPDKLIRVRLAEWLAEPAFFRCISNSDLVREEVEEKCATTVGNWGISAGKLKTCMFPLPPLAEQHRIVAKVDELMALCDLLEAARQQREQTRERLVAASLQRLNQPAEDPASFRQHAQFALQTLPSLTTTPAQIKQLRQSILNLAVRGKLVEPPKSWLECTLGDVGDWGSGGTPPKTKPEYYGGDIPWLVIGDLNDGVVSTSAMSITEEGLANSSAKIVDEGSLLIAMYGSIGKLGIAGMRCATNQAIAFCRPHSDMVTRDYLFVLLKSLRSDLLRQGQGVAQQNISQKILKAHQVEIPPLAEQHRIVAKVDELMALCDQLEQQLSQAGQQRRRLLEALLAEAFQDPEGALEVVYA